MNVYNGYYYFLYHLEHWTWLRLQGKHKVLKLSENQHPAWSASILLSHISMLPWSVLNMFSSFYGLYMTGDRGSLIASLCPLNHRPRTLFHRSPFPSSSLPFFRSPGILSKFFSHSPPRQPTFPVPLTTVPRYPVLPFIYLFNKIVHDCNTSCMCTVTLCITLPNFGKINKNVQKSKAFFRWFLL